MGISDQLFERSRKVAMAMLRVEAMILFALIVYLGLLVAIRNKPLSAPLALVGDFIGLAIGAIGLYLCSMSYKNGKSWGRAPAVLANLIALGVAYFMLSGKFYIGAYPLGVIAFVTAGACLLGYRE
jgi:hypothetical protein